MSTYRLKVNCFQLLNSSNLSVELNTVFLDNELTVASSREKQIILIWLCE